MVARDEGLIAGIGISNVTHRHLLMALEVTDIVCVQNAYNLADRSSQPVLDECAARGIAFVPFCPLGWPKKQHDAIRTNPVVTHVATSHGATAGSGRPRLATGDRRQCAADPRHRQSGHLAENLAAGLLSLHHGEVASLTAAHSANRDASAMSGRNQFSLSKTKHHHFNRRTP